MTIVSEINAVLPRSGEIDFVDCISATRSEHELSSVCVEIGREYGLPHFAVMRQPTGAHEKLSSLKLMSNWPNDLFRQYDSNNLLENSPVISHLNSSTEPLVFDIRVINADRPDGRSMIATSIFENHGIYNGILYSVHLPNGRVGSVSFSGKGPVPDDIQILELGHLANLIYSRTYSLKSDAYAREFSLREREIECLDWTSKGKTSSEIGKILGLSEHTVNQYLANTIRKLDTTNRVHAVSKALRLNIIR